jgi:hypothetical protein
VTVETQTLESEMTNRIEFSSAGATRKKTQPQPTDYAPYHTLPAFNDGIADYMEGRYDNPHDDGVAAQAWDRGSEYAMRVVRFSQS